MPEIGAVLAGKYRVLAKLGEGGMGSVFRAENQLTGKQVALKCLHTHATSNADLSERLLREARAASSLSHPNVVDVYDIVRDDETLFLVMELLQGQTLGDYLLENPQPKISEFLSLLLPAMAGVAAAHARGVIHRDLKPDNIYLANVVDLDIPMVKVLDFGIAKLAVARGPTLTQTGMSLGTPLYMSLEQLRGAKDVDERTDVYAFGVMLYEAVTGSMPYEAETLPELAIKVATTDPAPVKTLRRDVPTPLARVIDNAVARDRDQRTATVRILMQELEVFARDHSMRAQMTVPEGTLPRLAAASAGKNPGFSSARSDKAPAPPPVPVSNVQTGLRAEPDTFRVRERIAAVQPKHARMRWSVAGAALVGALGVGGWWLDREPPVAPSRATAALPLAPPLPLSAPGPSLEPATEAAALPERAARTETPARAEDSLPKDAPSEPAPSPSVAARPPRTITQTTPNAPAAPAEEAARPAPPSLPAATQTPMAATPPTAKQPPAVATQPAVKQPTTVATSPTANSTQPAVKQPPAVATQPAVKQQPAVATPLTAKQPLAAQPAARPPATPSVTTAPTAKQPLPTQPVAAKAAAVQPPERNLARVPATPVVLTQPVAPAKIAPVPSTPAPTKKKTPLDLVGF